MLKHTFECNHGAVLSLAVTGDTIFAGCQEGYVRVFDLETRTLVRTIMVQEVCQDILCVHLSRSSLCLPEHRHIVTVHAAFRALHEFLQWSSTGQYSEAVWVSQCMNLCGFKRWSPTFNCTASWSVHEGIVLSSIITHLSEADGLVLVTGANDGFVKVFYPFHSPHSFITLHPDLGH